MSNSRIRKLLIIVCALFVAAFLAGFGYRWNIDHEGRKKLDAVVAQLDASDPRWSLEDLEADRPSVPLQENSAFLAVKFDVELKKHKPLYHTRNNGDSLSLSEIPANHHLDDEAKQLLERGLAVRGTARPYIRRLAALTHGRRSLKITRDAMSSSFDVNPDIYRLENYLNEECHLLAERGFAERPYERILAMLNLGRIMGDESLIRSQTQRMARTRFACRLMERMLAMDVRSNDFARIQSEFERESSVDYYRIGIRGQRGFANSVGRAIDRGDLELHSALLIGSWCGSRAGPLRERLDAWPYLPHLTADLADCLDVLTRYVAVAGLPDHLRQAAFVAVLTPPADPKHRLSTTLLQGIDVLLNNSLSTRAQLRSASAAVALERYRLEMGSWPTSFQAIPKSILAEVPIDPFTGRPLLLAKRSDGITVYSVGQDGLDQGGKIDVRPGISAVTLDIGIALYDPDQRRLPPLPVRPLRPLSGPFFPGDYGPEPRIVGEDN